MIQTTAPIVRSCPGLVKSAFWRIPTTSRTAEAAVAMVMVMISRPVTMRSQRLCRSMRPGSPIASTARNTSRSDG
ncbi:MAG: hypothetical protein Q8M17_12305 [Actinomycetota bacterium]|nr:hypothetical protein [Actinomycetota bacterium]